jgi:hypothetical protein
MENLYQISWEILKRFSEKKKILAIQKWQKKRLALTVFPENAPGGQHKSETFGVRKKKKFSRHFPGYM